MSRAATTCLPLLWGDGHADDGWAAAAAVRTWDEIHADEYLRLFPRLLPMAGAQAPAPVVAHLAQAVRALAARVAELSGRRTALTGAPAEAAAGVEARHGVVWFAPPSPWQRWTALLGPRPSRRPCDAGAEAALYRLDAVLNGLRAGQPLPYSDGLALLVAFHAALHPAYLWGEAQVMADCATAAGWLGLLARGRPALMPLDVAHVLRDAIEPAGTRGGSLRDARLAGCGFDAAQWSALGTAAAGRIAGRPHPVRLRAAARLPRPRRARLDATAQAAPLAPR